jgi:hypothetical protein
MVQVEKLFHALVGRYENSGTTVKITGISRDFKKRTSHIGSRNSNHPNE